MNMIEEICMIAAAKTINPNRTGSLFKQYGIDNKSVAIAKEKRICPISLIKITGKAITTVRKKKGEYFLIVYIFRRIENAAITQV
jgi:hypothetical protein